VLKLSYHYMSRVEQIEEDIAKLSPEELREVARWLLEREAAGNNRAQCYDFSGLTGRLQWRGDAVTEQRRLRNEW
jgi:hypothetical protein